MAALSLAFLEFFARLIQLPWNSSMSSGCNVACIGFIFFYLEFCYGMNKLKETVKSQK